MTEARTPAPLRSKAASLGSAGAQHIGGVDNRLSHVPGFLGVDAL